LTCQPENDPPFFFAKQDTGDNEIHIFSPTAAGPSIWANGPPENDWLDPLLDKIWSVESDGRLAPPDGDGGEAIGPLQIHQCVLDDVNEYYGTKIKRFHLRDIVIAKIIARLYIEMWMDRHKEEIAARIFKGGPRGWQSKSTDKYWRKINGK